MMSSEASKPVRVRTMQFLGTVLGMLSDDGLSRDEILAAAGKILEHIEKVKADPALAEPLANALRATLSPELDRSLEL